MDNRWNGSNTEGGLAIDGMAAIRREMDNRWNGSNTEGGWTIDGMAAIRREDGQ